MNDDFGDRMKWYEKKDEVVFDRMFPVYARIDGRSFSSFTKAMQKPFDIRMMSVMQKTAADIVSATHAKIAYVQSDEISLVWHWNGENETPWFGGRKQKIASVLSGFASSAFISNLWSLFAVPDASELMQKLPHFDCRVMSMPSKMETSNMLLWRSIDQHKNFIQSSARSIFSHSECQGKSTKELELMLNNRNYTIDPKFEDFKNGMWLRNQVILLGSDEEPRYRRMVKYVPLDVPFSEITNKIDFIFDGAEARTYD